jgi:hypothetical protein
MRNWVGIALGLLLVVGAAGCGGADGGTGVATTGQTGKPTSSAKAGQSNDQASGLKFAQCMREHGVPDFPDPEGSGVQIRLPEGADPQKVDAAMQQCNQYLPNGGEAQKADPQVLEQQRKFAQCMRDNGVPKFPDPDANGGIKITDGQGDVDPNDPTVKAAQQTCAKYQPAAPSSATQTRSNG